MAGGRKSAEQQRDEQDRLRIKTGLQLLVRNMRAASGTMKGLNKIATMDELQKEADDIETRLMPKYDDQGTLDLAGDD